ncbi:hypothetical protein [Streptomyces sp. TP-A0356]|uniref:hypothetical protein n=1 Tax=Streptomyces sp. TP-A0356 TaxID=1359208 RepID=UPI0006E2419D|nr:hypothetical protein [Streptomyces sp. TP-A0356]
MPAPRPAPRKHPAPVTAGALTRWTVFACALVPVVLVRYGISLAGAVSATLGLTAVVWACGALLRQSERGAAQLRAEERTSDRGRHGGTGSGARRGGRQVGGNTPVG